MGLGAWPTVTLGSARDKAAAVRLQVSEGMDPLEERGRIAPRSTGLSFGDVPSELIASLEPQWRSQKHGKQWTATLKTYADSIWVKPVDAVTADDILAVLKPIWPVIPETANRVRGRIERVLDAAKVRGPRHGENPAGWKGHLAILLPSRSKKSLQRHHAAMPVTAVSAFVTRLRAQNETTAVRALEFTILTAARISETLNAT